MVLQSYCFRNSCYSNSCSQGVCVPGGVPLAVVIGKEGFIANAVDAAAPPTAPTVGAFSIRKLSISSMAFIISSIISDIQKKEYCVEFAWAYFRNNILVPDISVRDTSALTFITGTFCHGDFSALWTFHGDFLAAGYFDTGTFLHRNTLAWGHYGTGKFWHRAKQYEHFGTDILASVQKYVTAPKCVC